MTRALVLGGTSFVGPALVDAARSNGWDVTVANRGSVPLHRQDVTFIECDRTDVASLAQLATAGPWDLVFDAWAGEARVVSQTVEALADVTGRWGYVSTRSVYAGQTPLGADESAAVVDADPDAGPVEYSRDKRGGELALERTLGPERVVHARAGLILGPKENIGRLTWWLQRVARGGRMVVPAPPDVAWQYIDARDLAELLVRITADGVHGPVDTVSPPGHVTTASLVEACKQVTGSTPELHWVQPDVLSAHGITAWGNVPGWIPPGQSRDWMHGSDVSRALSLGMVCRPILQTAQDQWDWMNTLAGGAMAAPMREGLGITPAQEQAVLDSWISAGPERDSLRSQLP
jgi:2'-hydroxyisoflavone reductase